MQEKYQITKEIAYVLSKKGTLEIISLIHTKGSARHKELTNIIKSGTTLTTRLNELLSLGVVERNILNEKYRPTEYKLTDAGKRLVEIIDDIEKSGISRDPKALAREK